MKTTTAIRIKFTRLIALLLLSTFLLSVLSVFPSFAEDSGVIANGVYLVDNLYTRDNYSTYGNFYLRADDLLTSTNTTPLILASTNTYGSLTDNLYRYWYFEHLGNNEYVIRSMVNQNQVLTLAYNTDNSPYATLSEIGNTVPDAARWIISGSSSYSIKCKSDSTKGLILQPITPTGTMHENDSSYYYYYINSTISTLESMSFEYWKLTPCSDISNSGILDSAPYYIMNYNSGRYLSLASASNTNSTNVCTKARGTSTYMQWEISVQNDLTYQLINVYSSTDKVLNVSGTNVNIYTNTGAANQMFTITRIDSGTYQGLYYIKYGSYYVAQDTDYNVYLRTTLTADAVWSFMAVNKGSADMDVFSYDFTNADGEYEIYQTITHQDTFKYIFDALGYTENSWRNPTPDASYTRLLADDIYVYHGHASPSALEFYNAIGGFTGYLSVVPVDGDTGNSQYINSCPDNQLASLRCALYLGCNTGVSYNGYNLVDATYQKGAHFVLGTTQYVITSSNDDFLEYFMYGINEGRSIESAYLYAEEAVGIFYYNLYDEQNNEYLISTASFPGYSIGDQKQYLN